MQATCIKSYHLSDLSSLTFIYMFVKSIVNKHFTSDCITRYYFPDAYASNHQRLFASLGNSIYVGCNQDAYGGEFNPSLNERLCGFW